MAFNVHGVKSLSLDGPTLAGIYLGQIKKLNDPQVAALPESLKLPNQAIVVGHRADGSGTTWRSKVGGDRPVHWPCEFGGAKNDGVAALVKQNPGTIGYAGATEVQPTASEPACRRPEGSHPHPPYPHPHRSRPMRITAVRTTAVRVPLTEPVKWSGGTRETAPAVIVEIETDSGLVGLGECNGPTLPTIETIVNQELAPILVGADPRRLEFLLHKMDEHVINYDAIGRYAVSGLDIALCDLAAKAHGCRVCDLLGGVYRESVEYMGYMFIDTPENNAAHARRYVDQGFGTLKIKVGRDVGQDIATLRAVRAEVGWDVNIRIDANMAWSESTAIGALRRMAEFELQFCEQPIPWHDIAGLARVRAAVEVPIAADEALTGYRSALELIRHRAVDVFTLYVSEAGGLQHARDIVRLADAAEVQCVMGTWAELGIGTVAGAHVIASSRNFQMASDSHWPLQGGDVVTPAVDFVGPTLRLPDGPGLGVALDRERLAEYARVEARETVFGDADDPRWIPRIGTLQRVPRSQIRGQYTYLT